MAQIRVENLTFHYERASDNIFENVNFKIDTDWKLGFIGRNGRGKTTFLNLLLGKYPYSGSIHSQVKFEYFPYTISNQKIKTKEIAKNIIAPFTSWEAEMEERLLKGDEESLNRYGEIQYEYEQNQGYMIEELLEKELGKLQISGQILERDYSLLSYGEQTKVMIAALFLRKNSFLLIDEPTNHLDQEGRELLAEYLRMKKGFILVSHDRIFLDKCVDHVLSINRTNIEIQKGNYSTWNQNRENQEQYEVEKNSQLKKEIGRLVEAKRRTSAWSDSTERTKIGEAVPDRGFIGHKAAKMMKRAKTLERRQEEEIKEKEQLLKNVEIATPLKMNVEKFHKKRFIELREVSVDFEGNKVLSNINLEVLAGERVVIQGKNGTGKSTLLKIIRGEVQVTGGQIMVATGLKISYVSQTTDHLKGSLNDFIEEYQLEEHIFKTVLRQLDFQREQFNKRLESFSEGQKKKVLLAKSLVEPANLLIWDEPLNFIDIFSRIQIEAVIKKYNPTIIFVEHDKAFCEAIKTKTVILDEE